MSKTIEDAVVELDTTATAKTIDNQWYRGDEKVTLTSNEFVTYKAAVDQAVQNLVTVSYPEISSYVDASTGEYVEEPTPEQIENKEVAWVVSPERTFAPENRKVSFDGKISREMLAARELSLIIHQRNIEEGVTVDVAILTQEAEERAKK